MGPIDPVFASAFLRYFEKQWVLECLPDILPKVEIFSVGNFVSSEKCLAFKWSRAIGTLNFDATLTLVNMYLNVFYSKTL